MPVENTTLHQLDSQNIEREVTFSAELLEMAGVEADAVLKQLKTQLTGLNEVETSSRLKKYGLNEFAREKRQSGMMRLLNNLKNPLIILLSALAVISYLTGDIRATAVISMMVLLGLSCVFFRSYGLIMQQKN